MAETRTFLRRFLPVHVSAKQRVSPEAFECRDEESSLSLTLYTDELRKPGELIKHQLECELPMTRTLPGFCKTPWMNFKARDKVNLRHDPDPNHPRPDDHFSMDCVGEAHQDELALISKVELYPVEGRMRIKTASE